jgi:hypothetical protein
MQIDMIKPFNYHEVEMEISAVDYILQTNSPQAQKFMNVARGKCIVITKLKIDYYLDDGATVCLTNERDDDLIGTNPHYYHKQPFDIIAGTDGLRFRTTNKISFTINNIPVIFPNIENITNSKIDISGVYVYIDQPVESFYMYSQHRISAISGGAIQLGDPNSLVTIGFYVL